MTRVDYDAVAPTYDKRYDRNRYAEVRETLVRFVGDSPSVDVAEVGCGTGHWLAELAGRVRSNIGVDPSLGMLGVAVAQLSDAFLIRGRAEALPLRDASLDRLFCINAIHHFIDRPAFVAEARRVLRSSGRIMIIGLDPHTGIDQWWVYDYFPSALAMNLERCPSTLAIRSMLEKEGFVDIATTVAQHFPAEIPFAIALERGHLDRRSTSQLMVISDEEYNAGIERMTREQPMIRADLRVYATVAGVGARS